MTFVATAVVGAGITVGSAGYSAYKSAKAKKQSDQYNQQLQDKINSPPEYDIPAEYAKNQGIAQGYVNTITPYTKSSQLAGQPYMQNQVDNNSANSVAKAQQMGLSGSAIASVLASANNSSNDAATNFGIAGAKQRQSYIGMEGDANQNLEGQNQAMADQRAIKWNLEKNQPYQNSMAYYRDRFLDTLGQSRQQGANAQGQIAGLGQNMLTMGLYGKAQKSGGGSDTPASDSPPTQTASIGAVPGTVK